MSRKVESGSAGPIEISSGGAVKLRVVPTGQGETVLEMGVDYDKAEVPDRAYFADWCDVRVGRVGPSLFFGKLIPGTPQLRTKIEVTFPTEMFLRQLWASSRDFHETVRRVAAKEHIEPVLNVKDTDRVQTFRSNNVFMGLWGEESLLDFYYISPRDIHFVKLRKRADVLIEPVIRVVLDTAVMNEFLELCQQEVDKLQVAHDAAKGEK